MISATFSLVQQLTRLKAMPPVKIIHSSDKIEGQVFVPLVNFLCMLGTIGLSASPSSPPPSNES
jgi:KUP system potassium uptake protein